MRNQTNRLILHACPRCAGDLIPDEDDYFACLQCGRRALVKDAPDRPAVAAQAKRTESRREVTRAAA